MTIEKLKANHKPFEPNKKQLKNLNELRGIMLNLEQFISHKECPRGDWPTFDMSYYDCGTSACALGYAALIGIGRDDEKSKIHVSAMGELPFHEYSKLVFGADPHSLNGAYDWLFSSDWMGKDNSSAGVAFRIDYALEHGIPVVGDSFQWTDVHFICGNLEYGKISKQWVDDNNIDVV